MGALTRRVAHAPRRAVAAITTVISSSGCQVLGRPGALAMCRNGVTTRMPASQLLACSNSAEQTVRPRVMLPWRCHANRRRAKSLSEAAFAVQVGVNGLPLHCREDLRERTERGDNA